MLGHAELVAQVIRSGYQDATSTVLDRQVARDIVNALREAGWAAPEEVRAIVAAAGGRVSVSDNLIMDPPKELFRTRDDRTLETVVFTR